MSLKQDVLKRLSESGGYISGERLAEQFGKSRSGLESREGAAKRGI